jgi:hypothetical protein
MATGFLSRSVFGGSMDYLSELTVSTFKSEMALLILGNGPLVFKSYSVTLREFSHDPLQFL